MSQKQPIAVDFDGTIVTHMYPNIGDPVPFALDVLKELQNKYQLILFTMRSDDTLKEAIDYLKQNGLTDFWVNTNITQWSWTNSQKVYAIQYIDDAATGCPLKFDNKSMRHYVDWEKIREILIEKNIL